MFPLGQFKPKCLFPRIQPPWVQPEMADPALSFSKKTEGQMLANPDGELNTREISVCVSPTDESKNSEIFSGCH